MNSVLCGALSEHKRRDDHSSTTEIIWDAITCWWLLPIWISESGEEQQQYILKECGGNVII
jgi:hypothetical protein